MKRVGVLGHGFVSWDGGIDFLRTIVESLVYAPEPVEIHVILPVRGPKIRLRDAYEHAKSFFVAGTHQERFSNSISERASQFVNSMHRSVNVHLIQPSSSSLSRIVSRLDLDGLMPSSFVLPDRIRVPWVGYIADMQHRHIPENFSQMERDIRDKQFSRMLNTAQSIVVNSRAVAGDINCFYPEAHSSVFSLPFSAAPHPDWLADTADLALPVLEKHPFFIVCNQFWKHKDHRTLFRAFAMIAKDDPDIDLVCTGNTTDYRDSNYFSTLLKEIEQTGIKDRIHILGRVSKNQQIALIKRAIAVIQPTLFEGGPGGGSVYDAISLGVPCIVSDIPVNLELEDLQMDVSFFRKSDAHDLAKSLTNFCSASHMKINDDNRLIELGIDRRRKCGEVLLAALARAQLYRNY